MKEQQNSVLTLIEQDTLLKRVSSHRGGEYKGPCPFCGGKERLRVQPEYDFWICRDCGRSGDTIAYLVDSGRIDKRQAYKLRRGDEIASRSVGYVNRRTPPRQPLPLQPPNEIWQQRARDLITRSQSALWSAAGAAAIEWLRARGLTDATIQQARLGYNPRDCYEDRKLWGLDPGNRVWLPQGITIPWSVDGELWRVNVRRLDRPENTPKYIGPAGWSNALYNADQLLSGRPAILVEGEFDALLLRQVAGDLVTPVATGSTSGARRARWIAKLDLCSRVLATFDADDAGEQARRWWLGKLKNGEYCPPPCGDVTEMHQDGYDLRTWVISRLE